MPELKLTREELYYVANVIYEEVLEEAEDGIKNSILQSISDKIDEAIQNG